jgi:GntR family transcriptional regulator, transcriptional repressor for pyruvate dehydrogenase complex
MPASNSLFKALPSKRAFDEIADQIKDLIYSKTLKPGDKLPPERDLATQFGTGRMAVREALRILEQSGLIAVKQGSEGGAFVKEADTTMATEMISGLIRRSSLTMEDVMEVRIKFEMAVLEAAIGRITENDMEMLQKRINDAEIMICEDQEGVRPLDPYLLGKAYADFHLILARATNNPVYEIIMDCLMRVSRGVMTQQMIPSDRFKGHLEFHKNLYNALKCKDPTIAGPHFKEYRQAVKRHFTRTAGQEKKTTEKTQKASNTKTPSKTKNKGS